MKKKEMKIKPYESLPFTNNFIFSMVLQNNPEICKAIIEAAVGHKIKKIVKSPDREKAIDITEDGHGVRLDVIFEGDDTIYNIEIQTTLYDNIPKRSRYYQGMLDLSQLERGEDYGNLKKSYVIFINTFDLFGKGLPKYTFSNICHEDKTIELGDDAIKIFVNAGMKASGGSKSLKDLINYIYSGEPEGPLSRKIENAVVLARQNKEWRSRYMTFEQEIAHRERIAKEEGIKKGIKEGVKEGRLNVLKRMLKTLTIEQILAVGFSQEEIAQAQK